MATTVEHLKQTISVSIHDNENLQEFLAWKLLSDIHKEILISMSDHPDILKRVFMFDYLCYLPSWLLDEIKYNIVDESKLLEENLKTEMSVLFKSLGE